MGAAAWRRGVAASDLIDEIDIHLAPVLLGDGIHLYDAPDGKLIHLQHDSDDPTGRQPPLPATPVSLT
jgi:hypothetical protein